MRHKLSYDNTSFHTKDFVEMQELLKKSGDGDVSETRKIPGVHQLWAQQVSVDFVFECVNFGIGSRYDQSNRPR